MSELDQLLPLLAELSRSRGRRFSLPELAKEMGQSPAYFQRVFSRVVGESPKQFTKRLQMECAAVQLLMTDDSVLMVALAVGFDSHEGFTRAFTNHFGQSPKTFRATGKCKGLADSIRHSELLTHVGPCLRLFRVPSENPKSKETVNLSYEITKQSTPETTILFKTRRCAHSEIADTLGQVFPAIFQYATAAGIEMTGPPMVLYEDWGPGMTTLHAGMPVKSGASGKDDIEVQVLPAGPAAVTIHSGPYDKLNEAHGAVEVFVAKENLEVVGLPREIYLTDPGEVPDPSDWKTQVIWPVKE